MKSKLLKFFVVGAFLAFAACVFFISGDNKIKAQDKEAAQKKVEILEKVAGYKTWKQVVKPVDEKPAQVFIGGDFPGYG
ncbi:MAG TPA: hypothetical protein VF721_12260 [Pyrinomonadaceae bacterium]|jgi:hypothetical protein